MNVTINGPSIYCVSYPTLKFLSSCTHFKSTSSSGSLAPAGPQPMQKSCMLRSAPLSAWTKTLSVYHVFTSYYYSKKVTRIKMSINWISESFKTCKQAAHTHTHTHTPATIQLTNSDTCIFIIHRYCLDTTWQSSNWPYCIVKKWSHIHQHAA
jgi:hypothetical protein